MQRSVLLLGLGLAIGANAAIYRWVDDKGMIHFSDRPQPGAKRVRIRTPQTFNGPAVDESTSKPPQASSSKKYKTVQITQPEPEATIRNNQGMVAVSVYLQPGLQTHHRVKVLLDGKSIGEPQKNTVFSLRGIFRGEHTLQVSVVNNKGVVYGQSTPVTFYMHRPRTNMQPRNIPRPSTPSS